MTQETPHPDPSAHDRGSDDQSRLRLVALVLALGTLLLYLPVRHHEFLGYDDPDYITENLVVQGGFTWAGLKTVCTGYHASNWHPVTWMSHMLDCEWFGLDPGAHHLMNVLLHTANALLLFGLLRRLTGALWPAALAAALFAWHPLHVESVAWAAERKDVLSMFFALLTLLAYARYVKEARVQSPKAKGFYIVALIFFALGLMSKPMLVTLPFVMLLLDWWPLKRVVSSESWVLRWRRLVIEKVPFFILTIGSCILTYLAQRGEAVITFEHHPLGLRVENMAVAYVRYLFKTIWPANLAILYPLPKELPWMEVLLAAGGLAVLSGLAWRARRSQPYLLFGWLWFLGTLVPVIGLVQVGGQALADRYTYLPLVGIFLAVGLGGAELAARYRWRRMPLMVAAGLALAGCLGVTSRQLEYWRNSETIFTHAIAVNDSAVARVNLGVAYRQQGLREKALTEYRQAVRLNPKLVQAHNNLGALLDELGQDDEAMGYYREAVRLNPNKVTVHVNFGEFLVKLRRFDEALREYAEVERLEPGEARPHYLRGKLELKRGAETAAVAQFREALRRDENNFQVLTFLARTLASSFDPQIRNGTEAVALAERANELTGGEQPLVLDALAMAQAEAGRFADAQATTRQALDICTAVGETNFPVSLSRRLEFYSTGRAWREASTNSPGDK